MLDQDQLVFVEVKARQSTQWGDPYLAVNRQKRAKIIKTAQAFFQNHPQLPQSGRIDVISITQNPPEVAHYQNIEISA